jgi:hypothetical protein
LLAVGHLVGGETLDRADRSAVVAVLGVVVGGWILDGQALSAAGGENLQQQRDPLRVAIGDDGVLRPGHGAANAVEIVGERLPQSARALPIRIAEALVRRLAQHPANRAEPGLAGEGANVGAAIELADVTRLASGIVILSYRV